MIEDVRFLIEQLSNQDITNPCAVSSKERLCRINRENYYPDENGLLVFHKQTEWDSDCYSVGEMLELLKKYGDRVANIKFEDVDGIIQPLENVFEVENIGDAHEFDCVIMVGEGDLLKLY